MKIFGQGACEMADKKRLAHSISARHPVLLIQRSNRNQSSESACNTHGAQPSAGLAASSRISSQIRQYVSQPFCAIYSYERKAIGFKSQPMPLTAILARVSNTRLEFPACSGRRLTTAQRLSSTGRTWKRLGAIRPRFALGLGANPASVSR